MKPVRFFASLLVLIAIVFIVTFNSCSKDTTPTVPSLTTTSASIVTDSSATVGGEVTDDGGASVTERGACYNTSSNPTITDNSFLSGSGTGAFDCNLKGLNKAMQYYYKAYAMNSVGIGYGEQKSFTTQGGGWDLPTVTTNSVSNITGISATCGGNVTDQGSSLVTTKGVCWNTSPNPTLLNPHTTDGDGMGSFIGNMTGLTTSTIYYVRAYASNISGTAYGSQVSFITSGVTPPGESCPGIPTITDPRNGQTYPTVQIGDQCWLQNNMNYETGNSWCYNNDLANCNVYGRLYDWETALNVCPSGWHLPSDDEWKILEGTVDTHYGVGDPEWDKTGWRGFNAGKHMKSTSGWYENGNGDNSSGFTAPPGGYRYSGGDFGKVTQCAYYWSSTEYSSTGAWDRGLYYNFDGLGRRIGIEYESLKKSARCVKD